MNLKKINLTLLPVPKKYWMMESPQIDIAQLFGDLKNHYWNDVSMNDYRFLLFIERGIDINIFDEIFKIFKEINDKSLKFEWKTKNFFERFEPILNDNNYLIFPISVLEQFRIEYILPALLFSYFLKEKYPNKKIIFFWNYPKNHAELLINKFEFIDCIILNWDNLALIKFIKWQKTNNIIYRTSIWELIITNINHKVDIEKFSMPNFDSFDLDFYTRNWKLVLPYEFSRWCMNSCFFCYYIHKWWIIYNKNIQKVIDELSVLKKKYSTNLFHFHDAEINFDNEYLENLCDEIIKINLNIYWSALAIPKNISLDLLKKLYNSWCRQLRFWVESWSQRVLDIIKKETTVQEVSEILKNCKEIWINTYATFIVDLKQENSEDLKETLEFIKNNKNYIDDIQICSYWELWVFPIKYLKELSFTKHLTKISKKKILFEKFQYDLGIKKWDIVDFIRKF